MQKLKLWLLGGAAAVLTFVAYVSAASASQIILYQPRLPDKLRS